jgi:hypothetical protein
MTMSKHAEERSQQRGIREDAINALLKDGVCERAPGKADAYTLSKKETMKLICEHKYEIHRLERAMGRVVKVKDSTVVTVHFDVPKKAKKRRTIVA